MDKVKGPSISGFAHHPDLKSVFTLENKLRTIAHLQGWSARSKIVQVLTKLAATRRAAAVLIPLCLNVQGEPCLCFTLRSLKLSKHRGEICFPGGVSDPGDLNAVDTALRETEEELGITRDMIDVWCTLDEMPTASSLMGVTPVLGFLKGTLDAATLKVNPHEVEKAFTIPLHHFCDKENWGHTQFLRGLFGAPIYKNMKVYHPPGAYEKPTELSSSEEEDGAAAPLPRDVRLWGLTAILTHIVLQSLLPNVYKRHVPNL